MSKLDEILDDELGVDIDYDANYFVAGKTAAKQQTKDLFIQIINESGGEVFNGRIAIQKVEEL